MIMIQTALRGVTVPSLRNLTMDDNAAETDLLDLVPSDHVTDLRSSAQAEYMESLITNLVELDGEAGRQAREYTDGMTQRGLWTPGREGNASAWITRLIAKLDQLRAVTPVRPISPAPTSDIPAGRYAIVDGEVKCYQISYGREGSRWEGFLFLERISSDDRFPIRNKIEKARILEGIAADVDGAAMLAARTLRQCRRCGQMLSDTKNPYFEQGYGPDCGKK